MQFKIYGLKGIVKISKEAKKAFKKFITVMLYWEALSEFIFKKMI